ncbi:MAG TPA: DNA-3-methyladenine glycosylase 2 family protein [Firmicutes bacterium]|nr:DNA-3-methyladenine glycosylase 2 family protein [Candidatus Fermentithermobacillaceae bacterium]
MGEISLDIRETVVRLSGPVSLMATLECGQAFRWRQAVFPGRSDLPVSYRGVIGQLAVVVGQASSVSDEILVAWDASSGPLPASPPLASAESLTPSYVDRLVRGYFSDHDDIEAIEHELSRSGGVMADAVAYSHGLRILTQDPWECLASYVLSLNKNIPAISRTVEHLAACFGEPAGMGVSGFPSPEAIACQEVSSLRQSKCGFRDKYLHDAAEKVLSGDVDLGLLKSLPSADARQELMKIKGVGPKVADCVLLFGYHKLDVFPVDVWIARAVSRYFMGGKALSPREAREFGEQRFGPLAGYAQEYLFYWIRNVART